MKNFNFTMIAICTLAFTTITQTVDAADNPPGIDELWQIVQQQQAELIALRQELEAAKGEISTTQASISNNAEIVETVAEYIENPQFTASSWSNRTTIGGYGEMLYNHGTSSADSKELDIQRFVTFLSHEFNDELRFVSELEVEHSLSGDDASAPGFVELEQAYLEWDYSRNHSALAGMYLAPIGILNETHEPNTFYGVERNTVESRIIPTTYRVNGIKLAGRLGQGLSYDFGIHEGLFFESGDGGDIQLRGARQSGARAEIEDLAYTGRVRYTGLAGLELGVTLQYQTDMTQSGKTRSNTGRNGLIDSLGNPVSGLDALLQEVHLVYQNNDFGVRALYARWDIDRGIELVANNNLTNNGLGRHEQYGFYLESSYRITDKLGIFARYEETDERAGSNLGDARDSATNRTFLGFNYWLTDNAVIKLDYQFESDETERDLDGFNVGLGWQF